MPKAFISYRHVSPDQDLAVAIERHLTSGSVKTFVDRRMMVGTDWVKEIDAQLRSSDFLVVLLSEHSVRSDMVRQEISLAHELEQQGRMRILPVRVAFDAELPYDLGAYLNRLQYTTWSAGESHDAVCAVLLDAIASRHDLPHAAPGPLPAIRDASELVPGKVRAPLPAADPRLVRETGTVRLDSAFYVVRPADAQLIDRLPGRGETFVIKGPRQAGKSSLLARARAAAVRQGMESAFVDLQGDLADEHFATLDGMLYELSRIVAEAVDAPPPDREAWKARANPKQCFRNYLGGTLLPGLSTRLFLCLDEIDRVFDLPFRTDFFGVLRHVHNVRSEEGGAWDKLHLAIAHSTEPSLWISDINQSPFNVGERVVLDDFSREQAADLNTRYGRPLASEEDLNGVLRLVGGQPFLIRQALHALRSGPMTLRALIADAATDRGPFGDHLRRLAWVLHQSPAMKAAVRSCLDHRRCDDEMAFQRLRAAGIVKGDTRDQASLRCELYEIYFAKHL